MVWDAVEAVNTKGRRFYTRQLEFGILGFDLHISKINIQSLLILDACTF